MKLVFVSLLSSLLFPPVVQAVCYFSCQAAHDVGMISSNTYDICPDGNPANQFTAYCDQQAAGGGWMLFFAYDHVGGQNNALDSNTLPTDPVQGYSHINLQDIQGYNVNDIKSIRFHCTTSAHNRVVDFTNDNSDVMEIAYTGDQTKNSPNVWVQNSTPLSGNSANLPLATTNVFNYNDGGLWNFPFWLWGTYHWGVRGLGNRWECDDFPGGYQYNTLHQVWARVGNPNPQVMGDPHFKTWSGQKYDFHGVCDLVLFKNLAFADHLGMEGQIRTKKTREWSYISSAVILIGEETLEVTGGKNENLYWINGVKGDKTVGSMVLSVSIAGYPIEFTQLSPKSRKFIVNLGNGASIEIKTWNSYVSMKIAGANSEDFGSSVGLMGSYGEGHLTARDGVTIIDDVNVFGQEWQVLANEPNLFHNIEGPQAPQKCNIPSALEMRRRLGESTVTFEDAEIACSRVHAEDYELCVFDVMATNDKDAAGAY